MYVHPILIIVLIIVGFIVYLRTHDVNGRKKLIPEPFFATEKQKFYYCQVERLLENIDYDFASRILMYARDQLKDDYKQFLVYKDNPEKCPYRYYIDMFPDKNYSSHIYTSWAVIFVRYYLYKGVGGMNIYSNNELNVKRELMNKIDKMYDAIILSNDNCPVSFIEAFDINNYD